MLTENRPYITYAKLNEQCRRAINVLERHGEKTPAIGSHARMLQPIVDRYFDRQDKLSPLKANGKDALKEGRQAVRALNRCMRSWFGQLNFAVTGFDGGDFRYDLKSPDTVIGAAERLIDFVRSQQGENEKASGGDGTEAGGAGNGGTTEAGETGPGPLWFAAQMVADLTAAKDAASSKWLEAQDRLAEEQELRSSIRESAIEVQHALVSLRKTLRHTLGTSHRDYQKLRLSRSYHEDADELYSVEQVEGLASDDESASTQSSSIGEADAIESEPFVVKTPPASAADDKGNGKGKPADVSLYLSPDSQATPPAGG